MSLLESFKVALSSIWNHKIRSILTMLGIIIGVAAVIIIVAIGQGAKTKMTEELFSIEKMQSIFGISQCQKKEKKIQKCSGWNLN